MNLTLFFLHRGAVEDFVYGGENPLLDDEICG